MGCFKLNFLDDKLDFCFQSGVSSQISALILEPLILSKIVELTCSNPDFERFVLISRGYDDIFHIMTVHRIDLPYHTPGTRR